LAVEQEEEEESKATGVGSVSQKMITVTDTDETDGASLKKTNEEMACGLAELIDRLLVDKTSLIKLMKLTTAQAPSSIKASAIKTPPKESTINDKSSDKSASDDNTPAISFSNLLTFQAIKD